MPAIGVGDFVDSLDSDDIYLSIITIGEIAKAREKLPKPNRKQELQSRLEEELLVRFDKKIVPLDSDGLVEWGFSPRGLNLREKLYLRWTRSLQRQY